MQERFTYLLDRYYKRQVSPAELQEFYALVNSTEYDALLKNYMDEVYALEGILSTTADTAQTYLKGAEFRMLRHVFDSQNKEEISGIKPRHHQKILWTRIATASTILLTLGVGLFYYNHRPTAKQARAEVKVDFKPGSNKATLTLAGGQQIILADAKNGKLATEAGTAINKTADGEVIYNNDQTENKTAVYNTMTTPRGGQYHLTLADGSIAWLNAASSITYPVAFNGKLRQVEITGEVYFQVAHSAAKPFLVKCKNQTVQVLGTHFNINAYDNEGTIKTTLLEGSVAVSVDDKKQLLKPGQQAILNHYKLAVSETDVTEAVAWKDGYFQFANADIETIMRQVSRWYDVDVTFEGPITKETFTGRISRFRNISEALKIVQSSNGVHLTYSGRRIMVRQ